jgi:hypothetical protein
MAEVPGTERPAESVTRPVVDDAPPLAFDPALAPAPDAAPGGELPTPAAGAPGGVAGSRGLAVWLAVLTASGVGGLLLGMQEVAALVAIAGLFVASQAADLDARWKGLYYLLAWVVPCGGAAVSLVIAFAISRSELAGPLRSPILAMSVAGAVVCLLTVFRPISNSLSAVLFRTDPPSHTLRLSARMTLVVALLALPGWFAFRSVMDEVLANPESLLERVSFGGELLGYVLLALASVGFMVRRDLRATLERLGIHPIGAAQLAMVAIGVFTLYALNTGTEWLERVFFNDLWKSDQRFTETIASGLGPGRILMLGLSAGIGEEITLRGALQPKLGLVTTSLLFAALHVQYSWFGMCVIFLLGLTLGTIRMKTSTSVAMAVHTIYDVLAVLSV